MADMPKSETAEAPAKPATQAADAKLKARRVIAGDFSYTTTPGKLKTALDKLLVADRPEIFNKDFIETYLGVSGGSAAPIPNIMKRIGFVGSDGKPTELYGKFQSDTSRPEAALEGLRKGFSELFKKNVFAHSLPEDKLKDALVEITGLKKNDPILSLIYGTFDAIRSFIPAKFIPMGAATEVTDHAAPTTEVAGIPLSANLGLSYHINIVLPETKDISVFNAIFQSLKQNLLS